MLVVLDPDICAVALGEHWSEDAKRICLNVIVWLLEQKPNVRIVLDPHKTLFKEFYDLLERHMYDITNETLKLLESIVDDPEHTFDRTQVPDSGPKWAGLLQQYAVTEPVEPLLLKLAAALPKKDLAVILVPGPKAQKRMRMVHTPAVRNSLMGELNGGLLTRHIILAEEAKVVLPTLAPPEKTQRSFWFEDKVRLVFREVLGCTQVRNGSRIINGEEVDFYGHKEGSDLKQVWVGECKLREHNLADPIRVHELDQLMRKKAACSNDEQEQSSVPLQVNCFLVSNAPDIEQEAQEKAFEIGAEFFQVLFTEGWQTTLMWEIAKIRRYEFVRLPDGTIKKHCIERISIEGRV